MAFINHRGADVLRAERQAQADNARRGIRTLDPERARVIDLLAARNAVANTGRDLESAYAKAERFKTKPSRMSDRQYRQVSREAARQLEWAQQAHHFAQRRLAEVKAEQPMAAE